MNREGVYLRILLLRQSIMICEVVSSDHHARE